MAIDYNTPIGQIRLIIGDLNEEDFEYTDEQIQGFLDIVHGNLGQASIFALQGLVSKYASTSGDEYRLDTITYKESKNKAGYYQSLLKDLQDAINSGLSPLSVGQMRAYGIYTADRKANYDAMRHGTIIPPRWNDYANSRVDRTTEYGPYYD